MKTFGTQDERNAQRARRRSIVNPVRAGASRGLGDIVSKAKAEPKAFAETIERLTGEGKIRLADVHLKDAQQALRDVEVEVHVTDQTGRERAVMASAFPLLVGGLMVAEINEGLAAAEMIGDQLVTDLEDPKRISIVDRVVTLDTTGDRTDEEKDFPEIGASEESYELLAKRDGRKLSITQELIEQSDMANIVERVNKLVEIATTKVEKLTLDAVTDRYGSAGSAAEPYVYRPRKTGPASLYTTSTSALTRAPSGTSISGNALASAANLSAARTFLANMRDDKGDRGVVSLSKTILLVPDALFEKASQILGSLMTPGVMNEFNTWGPSGPFRPQLLSSSRLDDISTTDWFLGDFQAQFRRKWVFRFENVFLSGPDTQRYLDRRIAWQGRIAWNCGVNAVDHNRVVRSQP